MVKKEAKERNRKSVYILNMDTSFREIVRLASDTLVARRLFGTWYRLSAGYVGRGTPDNDSAV